MNLALTPREQAFREELRAWLADNLPEGWRGARGFEVELAWQRRLHGGGWVAVHWPAEHGGRGLGPVEHVLFIQELALAGAPDIANRVGVNLVGPTLIVHGTEAQRARFLPRILSGEEIWCQLYSEPSAGSDLASLSTRAERAGDRYVVTGQKVWSSYAQHAAFGIALVRTDPAASRHRGLTCLAIPMDAAGVEVRPLRQITGEAEFCEVFLDRVEVPVEQRIGAEGEGWRVAQTTLAHERGVGFPIKEWGRQRVAFDRLRGDLQARLAPLVRATLPLDSGRTPPPDSGRRPPPDWGRTPPPDPGLGPGLQGMRPPDLRHRSAILRDRAAGLWVDLEVLRLLVLRTASEMAAGSEPGPETSLAKLQLTRVSQGLADLALDALCHDGWWMRQHLWSRAASIAGGTDEIQRNVLAERVLGMPR